MSKYHAKPQVVDGIRFASQKEARRYGELKMLEKAGVICGLRLQPKYDLTVNGIKVGVYIADFAYSAGARSGACGRAGVEDVKGFKTPLYRLKKKMVEAQYGIRIIEI
jgi:hypothetical protein